MPGDMTVLEARVFPLLEHVSIYIRYLESHSMPRKAPPYRMRCYEILTFARNAYRRPLKGEERRQLAIHCDKLFSSLPEQWQRLGAPPYDLKGLTDDDE